MTIFFRALNVKADWEWIRQFSYIVLTSDTVGIAAVDLEKNELVAVVIFDNWKDTSVHAHIIIKKTMVLKYGFLEEIADYVFNKQDKKMILGFVESDNKKSLKFHKNIGFTEVARIESGFEESVDMVIIQMKKENCRFLQQKIDLKEVA